MADVVKIAESKIQQLADAVRTYLGSSDSYTLAQMAEAISNGGAPATPTNAVIFYSLSSFTLEVGDKTKRWNGTIQYSTNNSSYSTWNGTTTLTAAKDTNTDYYVLYLRGINNTIIVGSNSNSYWKVTNTDGNIIKCCGNLNKLLNYSTDVTSVGSYCFMYLFYNNSNMDFDVTLPATTLANYCYNRMFYGCTSLTKAPALPATTLKGNCYQNMFYGCTSLTKAPALPATTLAGYCYANMFQYCTSLTEAPALPATTLAGFCYTAMFANCTSLTEAPALPATTLARECYSNMFSYCTSLTEIPALPATTLTLNCYYYMFSSCSNVKISASQTGIYQNAYRIPTEGTGTTTESETRRNMFYGTGGTFTGTPTINTTYYTSNTIISPPPPPLLK